MQKIGNKNCMICLSKNLTDEYVNRFAQGAKLPVYDYDYDFGNETILIRGSAKSKLIQDCWNKKHPFYYMDSGYLGNYKGPTNPNGYKVYHRIVPNDLQHSEIIDRPDDRFIRLGIEIHKRKKGKHILVVVPSDKPCKFYNIDKDKWIRDTVANIKKHTDRPIVVREKQKRQLRLTDTIFDALEDCHAMVTYQSVAAVESVLYGVPAFTSAPTAADPVSDKDLSLIDNPTEQDEDKIYKWACHLAYGQFHNRELSDGTAYRMINEDS